MRELTVSGGVSADVARIDPKLVETLQRLRDHVGKAVKITSGYRSWKRNQQVYAGRKPTYSQHCGGRAADIKIQGMNGLEIGKAAIDACGPDIGVGLGNNFVHIDVRGYPAAWKYSGVKDAWVEEIKRYQQAKGGKPRPAPSTAEPPAELVRFAQRVLNAAEGERLAVDGGLGPLTQGALERFRKKYNLGPGGVLDDKTQLALAQRALEELAQQSMFEKGKRDAATDQALSAFKTQRGLGAEPTLDAATRAALTDALARRTSAASAPAPVTAQPSASGFLKDVPRLRTAPLKPSSSIVIPKNQNWPPSRRALADTYNRLGGLMSELATELNIEPPAVLAVWFVESGGRPHTPGQATIRFENHILFRFWGRDNERIYNQHFRHEGHDGQPGKAWEKHQYREIADQPFKPVHTGEQEDEYAALNLATRLAGDTVALQCISIGGPQILVRNYPFLGYRTPCEMYVAFQASERWHVLGFFDFCRTKPAPYPGQLMEYLRDRNWNNSHTTTTDPARSPNTAKRWPTPTRRHMIY